jgi:hypothetical protein
LDEIDVSKESEPVCDDPLRLSVSEEEESLELESSWLRYFFSRLFDLPFSPFTLPPPSLFMSIIWVNPGGGPLFGGP